MRPLPSATPQHIAIIGGGFSGTLLAINLIRHNGPRVTLIEHGRAGRGLAYATHNASHLLNVRASNMSAFPDQSDHFSKWFERHGGSADGFASRQLYGRYLQELLDSEVDAPSKIELVAGTAVGCHINVKHVRVTVDRAPPVSADMAILAVGNLPPHPPAGLDPEALQSRYRSDPWSTNIAEGLSNADRTLLIGTGLTAVDAALSLRDNGFCGQIVALSRRGLLPRPHGPSTPSLPEIPQGETRFAQLLGYVRQRALENGWRGSVDELRPVTQRIWQRADGTERARFLRHLRPWWDVHRHRLAPEVAAKLDIMQADGQLQVHAGTPTSFSACEGGVRVIWRPRGSPISLEQIFGRVVNCTGPGGDLTRAKQPLLDRLLADGFIRPDPMKIGVDVDLQCRTLGSDGQANEQLLAVGPLTRGTFWEMTAVPDIRRQVWDIARRLSNAHWVGGNL